MIGCLFLHGSFVFSWEEPEDKHLGYKPLETEGLEFKRIEPTEVVYEDEHSKTVRVSGHFFRIAKDHPIEKSSGYIVPIGIDSYWFKKIKEIEDMMQTQFFDRFDSRLSKAEGQADKIKQDAAVLQSQKE